MKSKTRGGRSDEDRWFNRPTEQEVFEFLEDRLVQISGGDLKKRQENAAGAHRQHTQFWVGDARTGRIGIRPMILCLPIVLRCCEGPTIKHQSFVEDLTKHSLGFDEDWFTKNADDQRNQKLDARPYVEALFLRERVANKYDPAFDRAYFQHVAAYFIRAYDERAERPSRGPEKRQDVAAELYAALVEARPRTEMAAVQIIRQQIAGNDDFCKLVDAPDKAKPWRSVIDEAYKSYLGPGGVHRTREIHDPDLTRAGRRAPNRLPLSTSPGGALFGASIAGKSAVVVALLRNLLVQHGDEPNSPERFPSTAP
ncbi:MAG: hypothetical protein R3D80_13175 [Paracoccaceae bacterium]